MSLNLIIDRFKQLLAISVGFVASVTLSFVLFALIIDIADPVSISPMFITAYAKLSLSLTGIAILILATTKTTEIAIRNQFSHSPDNLLATVPLYLWYGLGGFGFGLTFYFHIIGVFT
jgi:cytochrome c biogenesis protein CcdA